MDNTQSFSNKNYAYPYYHNTNKLHYVDVAKPTLILLATTFSPAQLHPKSLSTQCHLQLSLQHTNSLGSTC
jgi:hypothetical protein